MVIDTSPANFDGWAQYGPDGYAFVALLQHCYRQVGLVDKMTLWQVVDPACVRESAA